MHEKSSNLNIQVNLNFGKVTSNLNFNSNNDLIVKKQILVFGSTD